MTEPHRYFMIFRVEKNHLPISYNDDYKKEVSENMYNQMLPLLRAYSIPGKDESEDPFPSYSSSDNTTAKSSDKVICPQSSVCKPGNCTHKMPHLKSERCKENDDTKCDVCNSCQPVKSSEKVLDETLAKIEDYCQAEREDTRDAKYSSKDYEHGMIIMSNRIHSFVEHIHDELRQPTKEPRVGMKEKEVCFDDKGNSCCEYHEGLCMYSEKPKAISHMKSCPIVDSVHP